MSLFKQNSSAFLDNRFLDAYQEVRTLLHFH